jgi:dihydrofolate synthase/folylpolyglutamate synthase
MGTVPNSLSGWLAYLETLHPKAVALGLDRVREVLGRLDVRIDCPVITVGGTNGKGSTCAMLESIYRCAGYATGLYSSPHLLRYNERVRIRGAEVGDDALVQSFNAIEDARGDVPLTYFEFGTLAATWLFSRARLDVLVLEVGLGGRLDAVNVIDADIAVVTSVDIDHVDYLGSTREDIGREKAGIFRRGRPAICGDRHAPASVEAVARDVGARLFVIGRDYDFTDERTQWRFRGPRDERYGLPVPALRGAYQLANASTALAAIDLLYDRLPVNAQAIREGLLSVVLSGRFQVMPGRPTIVLDVAHNPHAARSLAAALGAMGFHPRTFGVCAMLADKDVRGVVEALRPRIDRWFVAGLPGARGGGPGRMRDALIEAGVHGAAISAHDDVATAFRAAREAAGEADRIVVFGSFLTVAAALAATT